jgi:hypothetical protein
MLRDGVDGVTEVPGGRWDATALLAEGIGHGGLLSGVGRRFSGRRRTAS